MGAECGSKGLGPGVDGAEGVGVEDGVGTSTTHILRRVSLLIGNGGSKREKCWHTCELLWQPTSLLCALMWNGG